MPACQLFCRAMQKIGASSEFCAHALNSALFSVILNLVVRIRISFRGSVFPEPFWRVGHGVQRPADHPGAVGAVVRFERAAGEITFVRSYFN